MWYKSKYEKLGVLPLRIVKSNVSSVGPSSEPEKHGNCFSLTKGERSKRIRICSTSTFSYFDLYLYSVYAAHYVYLNVIGWTIGRKLKENSSCDWVPTLVMMTLSWNLLKAAFRASEKKEISFSATSTVAMRRLICCGSLQHFMFLTSICFAWFENHNKY